MSPEVVQVRLDICAGCPHGGCDAQRAGAIVHGDPCASCPMHVWDLIEGDCREAGGLIVPAPAVISEPVAIPRFSRRPGSMLKWMIWRVSGELARDCRCSHRAQQMDQWGWIGCLRRRKTISGWLVDEADKRGYEVDSATVAGLFRAAWREFRKPRA